MSELVLGTQPPSADAASLAAWLAPHALDAEETAAFCANLERLLVYRTLVRGTLIDAVALAIPRTLARLGAVFDSYFDRFLAERGPRTHYLRDVTHELLDFVEPLFAADPRVAPYALDLARHEALEIAVASSVDTSLPGAAELELDLARGLCFSAGARVMRYAFAVHELPGDLDDRSEPVRRPTALFVYRSREHDVRYLELSAFAARLLDELLAGTPLGSAVQRAAARENLTPDSTLIDGTARLLADLAERGAILGPTLAPEPSRPPNP